MGENLQEKALTVAGNTILSSPAARIYFLAWLTAGFDIAMSGFEKAVESGDADAIDVHGARLAALCACIAETAAFTSIAAGTDSTEAGEAAWETINNAFIKACNSLPEIAVNGFGIKGKN